MAALRALGVSFTLVDFGSQTISLPRLNRLAPDRLKIHRPACLHEYGIAVCQSDAADWPLWDAVTTDLVYVRLHGHTITYASRYTDRELRSWARRVRRWLREGRDVHVYFDNDAFGHAPRDALRLIGLLPRSMIGSRGSWPKPRAGGFGGQRSHRADRR